MAFKLAFCLFFLIFVVNIKGQKVHDLDEDNWTDILKGEWMVEFYAPWCPACKALGPLWNEYARSGPALGIKVGAVDVTTSPGLSGRFMVTALPTIFHVLDGQFRQYKGTRDIDAFSTFIEEGKWKEVEPISSWKAPDSVQMSVISWFFKLSQTLRQVHNKFTNEYGLPTIVSYLIFAIATIILGACLGLVLVCAIDLIFPQKATYVSRGEDDQKEKDSDNELSDEDIKDDLLDQDIGSDGDHAETGSESSQKEEHQRSSKPRKRKTKRDM